MPIEVDEERRLDEIATATIRVARERGVRSVTIRAVAQQLGGSTAMVTNYVPTRAALMVNALRRAERDWNREIEDVLGERVGLDRLRELSRWMCTTTADDEVMRRLLTEIASEGPGAGPELERVRRATARDHHDGIAEGVAQAGLPDVPFATDLLFLLFRGYWLATLEDAETWTPERAERVVLAAIELLRRR